MKEPTLKDVPKYIKEWIEAPKILNTFLLVGGITSTKDYERLINNEKLDMRVEPILINNKFTGTIKLIKL